MTESRLKLLLAVLPVLSAGLYSMGATYHQSYLGQFGVEESMFPLPVDRLVFSGAVSFMTFGFMPMVYGILAVAGLVVATIFAAILSSAPRMKQWQELVLARLRKRTGPRASASMIALVDKSASLYSYCVGISFVVGFLFFAALFSARNGSEQAQREIRRFSEATSSFMTLTADGLPEVKAKQIICGAIYCAFWNGTETLVLKHDQIRRVTGHQGLPAAKVNPGN